MRMPEGVEGLQTAMGQKAGTERLRIALFTETFLPRIDGVVTRLSHTVRHLQEFGHEVLVISPDGGLTEHAGAKIHGVAGVPFPPYPELKVSMPLPSIGKVLREFRPNVIHASQPVLLGIAAFYYSVEYKVPLVVSYHTQLPKWLKYYKLGKLEPLLWWGLRTSFNRADLVLATSQVMKELLEERGIRRVELWQRGVDTELFRPERASQEMRARLTQGHPEDPVMLFVGRLSAEKEIETCRKVQEAMPEMRLALVGDGPHRGKLEEHFAGTKTYFAGYLRGEELASAFASSDVFYMPSRTETLGLVLLEAMAAGCPVVAAAEGGILDVVKDGVTGHLYDANDPGGAASAIRKLIGDRRHRDEVRKNARADAEKWGWVGATRQLEEYYRGLLRREAELPGRIAAENGASLPWQEACERLGISRSTLRRFVGKD